ncbi:MAG: hypothetical protein ACXWVR_11910 [Rhodoplanes sp.]
MLRRWRGRTEIVAIEALEPEQPIFGAFRVRSGRLVTSRSAASTG